MSIIYTKEQLPKQCKLNYGAYDWTNTHLYNLTFIYPCRDNNNKLKWICKCDCGNYIEVFAANVKRGNTKSCGCFNKKNPPARKDLTGKRYGKLVVIGEPKESLRKNGGTLWLCKCDCGRIVYKESTYLVHGNTKSCGCLKKELHSTMNDLTNQQFGELTALFTDSVANDGQRLWHCKCSCGNETIVRAGALRKGKTTSCGCKTSKNNMKIEKYLKDKQINFQKEFIFNDLYVLNNKGKLKFDFAIFNDKKELLALIEYQGIQHFQPVEFFGGEEGYQKQIVRDQKKYDYCKNNDIPLYYINYNENTIDKLEEILNELHS